MFVQVHRYARLIEVEPLAVGTGAVESAQEAFGVFVEVSKDKVKGGR